MVCVMALAYAFIDENGTHYGESNPRRPECEFPYVRPQGGSPANR